MRCDLKTLVPLGHGPFRAIRLYSTLGLVLFVSVACDAMRGATPVREIIRTPEAFLNRDVVVRGSVTKSANLPLLPGIYWIDDGTGDIPIVTTGRAPLVSGNKLRIIGKVDYLASVGSIPLGVHLVEVQRK